MRLAVIPARGGSKRIPGKNIRPFGGKPMIAWAIAAARDSGCFERIVVSTDSADIARVAQDCGAEAPFLRPAELSDDHTGTTPVVAHAIRALQQAGEEPAQVCCIYATAPFLQATDLREGLRKLEEIGCDFVFSVTAFAAPIQRAMRITPAGRVEMFDPGQFLARSQDLEPAYHDAAQFYWGRTGAWLQGLPLFSPASAPLVLPRHRVQDIDTPEDWERAEMMWRLRQAGPP